MYFSFKLSRSFCKSVWDTFGYGEGIEGSPLLSKDRVLGVSLHVDKLITFLIGEEAAGVTTVFLLSQEILSLGKTVTGAVIQQLVFTSPTGPRWTCWALMHRALQYCVTEYLRFQLTYHFQLLRVLWAVVFIFFSECCLCYSQPLCF